MIPARDLIYRELPEFSPEISDDDIYELEIKGFECQAWHNDAVVIFRRDLAEGWHQCVGIDRINPDDREIAGKRYEVWRSNDDMGAHIHELSTDRFYNLHIYIRG